jgi:hypothetical protein
MHEEGRAEENAQIIRLWLEEMQGCASEHTSSS